MSDPKPTTIHSILLTIQGKLNAPKDLENKFGGYKYRSCESILKALKPLLQQTETTVTFHDRVEMLGDRFYFISTATLSNGNESVSAEGIAREDLSKKGMDSAQLSGATSSYARKYALNALFAIDDTKDSDFTNRHETSDKAIIEQAECEINAASTLAELATIYKKYNNIAPKLCLQGAIIQKALSAKKTLLSSINQ